MESDMPIELLVSREWNGTKWHYPNIERMVEENKRLRAELAEMEKQRDEARRDACLWSLPKGVVWNDAMLARGKAIAAERGWDCFAKEKP